MPSPGTARRCKISRIMRSRYSGFLRIGELEIGDVVERYRRQVVPRIVTETEVPGVHHQAGAPSTARGPDHVHSVADRRNRSEPGAFHRHAGAGIVIRLPLPWLRGGGSQVARGQPVGRLRRVLLCRVSSRHPRRDLIIVACLDKRQPRELRCQRICSSRVLSSFCCARVRCCRRLPNASDRSARPSLVA
jgi:hypothetical protein